MQKRFRVPSFFLLIFFAAPYLLSASIEKKNAAPAFPVSQAATEEISDRDYLPRLRGLIGLARTKIDVSLDKIAVSDAPRDPVGILVNDLIDATKRGVKVRIFLNTFNVPDFEGSVFLREDTLEDLRQQNVDVHFVNPQYRLNDRMIVIDGQWVLDGGLPWTKDGLETGLGSATLSYSEPLAQKKRIRLELLPLWDVQSRKEERVEGRLGVPLYLLQEMKYFPAMVRVEDGDAIKVFLALLRMFYQAHKTELTVSFSEMAQNIPADNRIEKSAAAFQVLKTLQRLAKDYELLKMSKEQPDQVDLELALPRDLGAVVGIPFSFFDENYAKDFSPRAIYAYCVILYRTQSSGESPVWLGSERNVEQDFPMTKENFRLAVEELRRKNLIEIFPFKLRIGTGYEGPETREYRYLVNSIPTLSERLATWNRLRDQFGDQAFLQAREMAEALGEPEDPKVIVAYLELLGKFSKDDVRALTQHIATLEPQSTPELMDYLRMLLQNETKRSFQLATTS